MSDKTRAELKEQIKIMNHNYQTIKEMHERGYQYSVGEIKRLQDELERTRKALDVAVDMLKSAHNYYEYCIQRDKDYDGDDINWDCTAMNMDNDIFKALEQITALEQRTAK